MTTRPTPPDAPDLPRVVVYRDGRRVGVLTPPGATGAPAAFQYDEAVLDDPTAAVSLRLPVRAAPYDEYAVLPCVENLLPDGDLRTMLAASVHRSRHDVVGLLGVFGGECAGALSLWPEGQEPPAAPTYVACTAATLTTAFGAAALWAPTDTPAPTRADDTGGYLSAGLAQTLAGARLALSGAQEKLALDREPPTGGAAPAYQLPVRGAPSTVLVKRGRPVFPGLLHNELAAMTLMAAAGVPTATHAVCALDTSLYETARFDRARRPDGTLGRLAAEDGCQLTGRRSLAKYAETGGPTYAELVTVLRRYSAALVADQQTLFRWAVANLALGNRDAHAKNVSLLQTVQGWRLAPAYDVVCTRAYRQLDDALPFRFGGALQPTALTPGTLRKAAREFGLTAALAQSLVADVCDRVAAARTDALHGAAVATGGHPVLEAMHALLGQTVAETRARLLGG